MEALINNTVPGQVVIKPEVIQFTTDNIKINISINNQKLKFNLNLKNENYESTEINIRDEIYGNDNVCHHGNFHAVKQFFIENHNNIPEKFNSRDEYFHTYLFAFMKQIYTMDNSVYRTIDPRINTNNMPKFHSLPTIQYRINYDRLNVKLIQIVEGDFISIENGKPKYGPPVGEKIIEITTPIKKI